MLTDANRAELGRLGVENVKLKLAPAGVGRGAAVVGFATGDMDRGDVEDWLAAETLKAGKISTDTLWWAKVAGWAALAGLPIMIILGVLSLAFGR